MRSARAARLLRPTALEDNDIGRVFTTAFVSLNIPESGLFADFVKSLKNDTFFHG